MLFYGNLERVSFDGWDVKGGDFGPVKPSLKRTGQSGHGAQSGCEVLRHSSEVVRALPSGATRRGWAAVQQYAQAAVLLFADRLKKKKKKQTALLLTLSPIPVVVVGRPPPAASQLS